MHDIDTALISIMTADHSATVTKLSGTIMVDNILTKLFYRNVMKKILKNYSLPLLCPWMIITDVTMLVPEQRLHWSTPSQSIRLVPEDGWSWVWLEGFLDLQVDVFHASHSYASLSLIKLNQISNQITVFVYNWRCLMVVDAALWPPETILTHVNLNQLVTKQKFLIHT